MTTSVQKTSIPSTKKRNGAKLAVKKGSPRRDRRGVAGPKPKIDQVPWSEVLQLRETDVICGRGAGVRSFCGNAYFSFVVWAFKDIYADAERSDKTIMALEIIEAIQKLKPPGRFVELMDGMQIEDGVCVLVKPDRAVEKTCQALRDKKKTCPDAYKEAFKRVMKKGASSLSLGKLSKDFQTTRMLQQSQTTQRIQQQDSITPAIVVENQLGATGSPASDNQPAAGNMMSREPSKRSSKPHDAVTELSKKPRKTYTRRMTSTEPKSSAPSQHGDPFLVLLMDPKEQFVEFVFLQLAHLKVTTAELLYQISSFAANDALSKQTYTAICRSSKEHGYLELCANTSLERYHIRPLEVLWAVPQTYEPEDICQNATLLAQVDALIQASIKYSMPIPLLRVKDKSTRLLVIKGHEEQQQYRTDIQQSMSAAPFHYFDDDDIDARSISEDTRFEHFTDMERVKSIYSGVWQGTDLPPYSSLTIPEFYKRRCDVANVTRFHYMHNASTLSESGDIDSPSTTIVSPESSMKEAVSEDSESQEKVSDMEGDIPAEDDDETADSESSDGQQAVANMEEELPSFDSAMELYEEVFDDSCTDESARESSPAFVGATVDARYKSSAKNECAQGQLRVYTDTGSEQSCPRQSALVSTAFAIPYLNGG
jgi:hypothetical protein